MVNNDQVLDGAFTALAHPVRRRILERLADGPATVGEAAAGIDVSKPAITKHVHVLEEADLVVRAVEGRRHRLTLNEPSLAYASKWIERHRRLWERKFEVIDEYLAERREP